MPGLDEAVLDAGKTLDADGKPIVTDDKKVVAIDDKKKDEGDGLTDDEVKNARAFYRGLKDPDKAPVLIDAIAKQAGYAKIETKADLKEAKKDVRSILTDKLGSEYEPLIDKLGPALDEILEEKLKESQKDIRDEMKAERDQKLANDSLAALKVISTEQYDGKDMPDNVLNEMKTLMEEFDPSPNMTLEKYLKHMHTLALGNLGLSTSKTSDKIKNNRDDVASRLTSDRGATSGEGVSTSKKMSLHESVMEAVKQLDQQK